MLRVETYVAYVTAAAVAAVAALYVQSPEFHSASLAAAAVFAALGFFAQLLAYQLAHGAVGSIAFIPVLTTAALTGDWLAPVAAGVSMLAAQLLPRRPALKLVFNVAQYTLATGVAVLVYRSLGGESILRYEHYLVLPYIALFAVFIGINTLCVSGAIAVSEGRGIWDVWKENTAGTIVYDLLSLPIAYIFAWVYMRYGAIGAILLAAPLLGIRQLYKTNWQLEKINQELLQLMVAAIEARDPYTSGHSKRVSHYARLIARACGLSGRPLQRVSIAALLHDVGKIHEIYAPILRKPDRLTVEEQLIIQTHPIKSAELVQNVSQLKDIVAPVRHHHENWDGTGYPDGIAGTAIPLAARIIMIADTIDAMTSDRPYRQALGPTEVQAELERLKGKQFDPQLCEMLLESDLFDEIFAPLERNLTPRYGTLIPLANRRPARAS